MFARLQFDTLLSACALTLGASLAHADIYTWTDASGRTNVSNLPPPEGARVSHVVHETPPPVAAPSDSAREAARQAELRVLSERVQQLEAEANARNAVPPDLTYARAPPPAPPPPTVQYNVTLLPPTPQYDAGPSQQVAPTCDPTWFGCGAWWGTYFYPVPAVISRAPGFHRFPPFRGEHPSRGQQHVMTPLTRMPGAIRKG
jgi:Domain of unknown function (DUF4124)